MPKDLKGEAELAQGFHERALRSALWLAILHARFVGQTEVQSQLTSILINVKAQQRFAGTEE